MYNSLLQSWVKEGCLPTMVKICFVKIIWTALPSTITSLDIPENEDADNREN